MTDEQKNKYKDAAMQHSKNHFSFHSDPSAIQAESFFMGCELAHITVSEDAKKAHNDALDKVIVILQSRPYRYDDAEMYNEILKLKI